MTNASVGMSAVGSRDFSHFVRHRDGGLAYMELAVDGIHCAGCMAKIERNLRQLPSVTNARVNLTRARVGVEWKEGALDPGEVVDRLNALGYKAYPFEPARAESEEEKETRFLLRCLGVAAFAAMNVMLLSVSVWSGNVSDITPEQRDLFHWLSALIALPAAAYAGQPFFRSAIRALLARNLNMDVPITLGVVLALAMSVAETLQHAEHAYFDSALMLLTFLLLGRVLDQNMRRRTRAAAGNLAAFKAETAAKFVSDTEIRDVPVALVHPGDLVLVRPGERIAVDGIVVEGRSEIDQSLITGETRLAAAAQGTAVYAGTLNISGALRVRSSAAANLTLLDEVTRLLDNAMQARSGYVRLADRAARFYSPVVHLTALATMLGWVAAGASWHDAIITAIAVLIITCPCALGLAIPIVQVVASGALFKSGVLLNAGDAIERLAVVDTVLFDKTGTLTLPQPEIVNAAEIPADMSALAGRLALSSRHPLAAVLARAAAVRAPVASAVEIPGEGVQAELDGVMVRLGSPSFCAAEPQARAVTDAKPGASTIAFRRGDECRVFAVAQGLRPDAASTIARLKAGGYAIEILSGDHLQAVKGVARILGIKSFHAGMKPAEKIAYIAALKQSGRKVLMVGDGLNDAPALAAADASLSPVSALHLAQAAADAVFLGERLAPVVAALAMSGSSLLVTVNALRAKPRKGARRWTC